MPIANDPIRLEQLWERADRFWERLRLIENLPPETIREEWLKTQTAPDASPLIDEAVAEMIFHEILNEGDIAVAGKDFNFARVAYLKATHLAIAVAPDGGPQWRRHKTCALSRLAKLTLREGSAASALRGLRTCLTVFEELADGNPDDPAAKWDVVVALVNLVPALQSLGELNELRQVLLRLCRECKSLALQSPQDSTIWLTWFSHLLSLSELDIDEGELMAAGYVLSQAHGVANKFLEGQERLSWILSTGGEDPRLARALQSGPNPDDETRWVRAYCRMIVDLQEIERRTRKDKVTV